MDVLIGWQDHKEKPPRSYPDKHEVLYLYRLDPSNYVQGKAYRAAYTGADSVYLSAVEANVFMSDPTYVAAESEDK